MAKVLVSPKGTEIIGTLELIPGVSPIKSAKAGKDDGGRFAIEYYDQTDVDWNNQVTVTRSRQRVFVDEAGHEFLENELKLVDEDELEDADA